MPALQLPWRGPNNLHIPVSAASSSAPTPRVPLRKGLRSKHLSTGIVCCKRQQTALRFAAAPGSAVVSESVSRSSTVHTADLQANVLSFLHPLAPESDEYRADLTAHGTSSSLQSHEAFSIVQGGTVQAALRELLCPKVDPLLVDAKPFAALEPQTGFPQQLGGQLRQCPDWRSVQALVAQYAEHVNAGLIANAMQCIAKLHGPRGEALTRPERLEMQGYMSVLSRACLIVGPTHFCDEDIAAVLPSLATLQCSPGKRWLSAFLEPSTHMLQAACQQPVGSTTSLDSSSSGRHTGVFAPQCLGACAWALGRLRLAPPAAWMHALFTAAAAHAEQLTPRSVAQLLWGAARLGYTPAAAPLQPLLLMLQAGCSASSNASFSSRDVAQCLWALAALRLGHQAVPQSLLRAALDVVLYSAAREPQPVHAHSLALALWSCLQLSEAAPLAEPGHTAQPTQQPSALFEDAGRVGVMQDALRGCLPLMALQDVSLCAWSLSALNWPQLVSSLHPPQPPTTPSGGQHQQQQTPAEFQPVLSVLLSSAFICVREVAGSAAPSGEEGQSLSMLITALAHMGCKPPGQWMLRFNEAYARALPVMSAQSQANTLWALASMSYRPSRQWIKEHYLRASCRTLASYTPHALSSSMWALASLKLPFTRTWLQHYLHASGRAMFASLTALRQAGPAGAGAGPAAGEVSILPPQQLFGGAELSLMLWGLGKRGAKPPRHWTSLAFEHLDLLLSMSARGTAAQPATARTLRTRRAQRGLMASAGVHATAATAVRTPCSALNGTGSSTYSREQGTAGGMHGDCLPSGCGMTSQDISCALYGLARMGIPVPDALACKALNVLAQLTAAGQVLPCAVRPDHVALSIWACALLRCDVPHALLEQLLPPTPHNNTSSTDSDSEVTSAISAAAQSVASAPGLPMLAAYSSEEVSQLVWGLASLGYTPPQAWMAALAGRCFSCWAAALQLPAASSLAAKPRSTAQSSHATSAASSAERHAGSGSWPGLRTHVSLLSLSTTLRALAAWGFLPWPRAADGRGDAWLMVAEATRSLLVQQALQGLTANAQHGAAHSGSGSSRPALSAQRRMIEKLDGEAGYALRQMGLTPSLAAQAAVLLAQQRILPSQGTAAGGAAGAASTAEENPVTMAAVFAMGSMAATISSFAFHF